MIATFVLPFQITLVLFAVLLLIANALIRRKRFAVYSFITSMVLFIPSCVGVMSVVDTVRYGRFEYADTSALKNDPYILLPPNATDIVLNRQFSGHVARFAISTNDLKGWLDELLDEYRELNRDPEADHGNVKSVDPSDAEWQRLKAQVFTANFDRIEGEYSPEMKESAVTLSARGGGITVWNVPGSGVAYLRADYW